MLCSVRSRSKSSTGLFELACRFSSQVLGAKNDSPGLALDNISNKLTKVMSGSALVVTRDVEWGQIILGFEQAQVRRF